MQALNAEPALGKALLRLRRADDALVVLERVLERSREQFGEGNYRMGDALFTYGLALEAKGRHRDAAPVLRTGQVALKQNRRAQRRYASPRFIFLSKA